MFRIQADHQSKYRILYDLASRKQAGYLFGQVEVCISIDILDRLSRSLSLSNRTTRLDPRNLQKCAYKRPDFQNIQGRNLPTLVRIGLMYLKI